MWNILFCGFSFSIVTISTLEYTIHIRWLFSTILFLVIYTLSARPKLLKWIWFDDVTLLILLMLLVWVGLFIVLLLAFNLNLFVLELVLLLPTVPLAVGPTAGSNGAGTVGAVDGVKWYAEFCTDIQLPSSFDLINNGWSIFRPLSQPPKFILSHRPLFGKRFRLDVPGKSN